MSEDKACRAEFEAWCKQRSQNVMRDDRPDFADGYLNLITQCFWVGWQAGRAAKPAVPATCEWDLTGDYDSLWESSCGEAWSFIDGGPTDNNMKFCHGCGKPLAEPAPPETAKEDA